MSYLTPAAFRYFLPAFLLMFIDENEKVLDVLAESIVTSLCPHEGWRDKIRGLTIAQQQAVLAFLLQLEAGRHPGRDQGVLFWTSHLERTRHDPI